MRSDLKKSVHLLLVGLIVAAMLAAVLPAVAQGTGVTVSAEANLRLRSEPSTAGQILGRIPYNTVVAATGINADGSWIAVNYNGQEGWVSAEFVAVESGEIATLPVSTSTFAPTGGPSSNVTVSPTNNLRLRAEASSSSATLLTIPRGATIFALALSQDGQWVETIYNGQRGWVSRAFLTVQSGDLANIVTGAAAPAATPTATTPAPAAQPPADPNRGLTADFSVEDATTTVTTGNPIWFNFRIRNNTLGTLPWSLIGVSVFQNGVELPGSFQTSWSGRGDFGVMQDFSWRDRVYLPGPGQYELRLTVVFADTGQRIYLGIPANVQMLNV